MIRQRRLHRRSSNTCPKCDIDLDLDRGHSQRIK